MAIPTEPIGSIPRPLRLIEPVAAYAGSCLDHRALGTALAVQSLEGRQ